MVHHLIPHHGDPDLFWCDDGGLEAACKRCHDGRHQVAERLGYSDEIGTDGLPVDSRHPWHAGKLPTRWGYSIPTGLEPSGIPVILVCGPPASGKSTYVTKYAERGDTVIDFDAIRQKAGGTKWDQDPDIKRKAFAIRARMLKELAGRKRGTCWFIVTAPSQAERDTWCKALGTATTHVMATTQAECIRRIHAAPERQQHADEMVDVVRRWHGQRKRDG